MASLALNKDYKFITTLTEEDQNTHKHVRQESLVVPANDMMPATMEVLRQEEALASTLGGFKGLSFALAGHKLRLRHVVIVFLPTARAAALFYDVFAAMSLAYPVWEIHSRMSQSKRTSTTEAFRQAERGVLFSSDVTARGIDIKDVTAVLQVGLPSSADQCECSVFRGIRIKVSGSWASKMSIDWDGQLVPEQKDMVSSSSAISNRSSFGTRQ